MKGGSDMLNVRIMSGSTGTIGYKPDDNQVGVEITGTVAKAHEIIYALRSVELMRDRLERLERMRFDISMKFIASNIPPSKELEANKIVNDIFMGRVPDEGNNEITDKDLERLRLTAGLSKPEWVTNCFEGEEAERYIATHPGTVIGVANPNFVTCAAKRNLVGIYKVE